MYNNNELPANLKKYWNNGYTSNIDLFQLTRYLLVTSNNF